METTRTLLPASRVLVQAAAMFGQIDSGRGLLSDAERLAWVAAAIRLVVSGVSALLHPAESHMSTMVLK